MELSKLYHLKLPQPPRKLTQASQAERIAQGKLSNKTEERVHITSVQYMHRERFLLVGTSAGKVQAWRVRHFSARERKSLWEVSNNSAATAIHYFAHFKLLAVGYLDGTIKLWTAIHDQEREKHCVQTLYGHQGAITDLCSADNMLFSASTNGELNVWGEVEEHSFLRFPHFRILQRLRPFDSRKREQRWVSCCAFFNKPHYGEIGSLYAADTFGHYVKFQAKTLDDNIAKVQVYEEVLNQEMHYLHLGSLDEMSTKVSGLGSSSSSSSSSSSIDQPSWKRTQELMKEMRKPSILRLESGDEELLMASVDDEEEAGLFELVMNIATPQNTEVRQMQQQAIAAHKQRKQRTGFVLDHRRRLHQQGITGLLVVPSENFVITISAGGEMTVFNTEAGRVFNRLDNPEYCAYTAVDFNGRTKEVVLGDAHGFVTVYNVFNSQTLFHGKVGLGPLVHVSILPARDEILCVGKHSMSFLETQRYSANICYHGHKEAVSHLLMVVVEEDEMDNRMISASPDRHMHVWDPYDMSKVHTLREPESEVTSMIYVTTALGYSYIVTGHENSMVRLWNPNGERTVDLEVHTNTVTALVTGTIGGRTYLFTGGFDGVIAVWDITSIHTREHLLVVSFPAHDKEIQCMCFDERDKLLISAGSDQELRQWHMPKPRLVKEVQDCHDDTITCMRMDGNYLITGSEDMTLRVWNVPELTLYSFQEGIKCHEAGVSDMYVLKDRGVVCSSSADGTVKFVDIVNERVIGVLDSVHKLRCLTVKENERKVMAGTTEGDLLEFEYPAAIEQKFPLAAGKEVPQLLSRVVSAAPTGRQHAKGAKAHYFFAAELFVEQDERFKDREEAEADESAGLAFHDAMDDADEIGNDVKEWNKVVDRLKRRTYSFQQAETDDVDGDEGDEEDEEDENENGEEEDGSVANVEFGEEQEERSMDGDDVWSVGSDSSADETTPDDSMEGASATHMTYDNLDLDGPLHGDSRSSTGKRRASRRMSGRAEKGSSKLSRRSTLASITDDDRSLLQLMEVLNEEAESKGERGLDREDVEAVLGRLKRGHRGEMDRRKSMYARKGSSRSSLAVVSEAGTRRNSTMSMGGTVRLPPLEDNDGVDELRMTRTLALSSRSGSKHMSKHQNGKGKSKSNKKKAGVLKRPAKPAAARARPKTPIRSLYSNLQSQLFWGDVDTDFRVHDDELQPENLKSVQMSMEMAGMQRRPKENEYTQQLRKMRTDKQGWVQRRQRWGAYNGLDVASQDDLEQHEQMLERQRQHKERLLVQQQRFEVGRLDGTNSLAQLRNQFAQRMHSQGSLQSLQSPRASSPRTASPNVASPRLSRRGGRGRARGR